MNAKFSSDWKRSHSCGELREQHDGQDVVLNGWVAHIRDLGNVIFVILRDRYGETQFVVDANSDPDSYQKLKKMHNEYVVAVRGKVRKRPSSMINPDMPTGAIEVVVSQVNLLNVSAVPPFAISDQSDASDALRLKYRYLDLRRPHAKQLIVDRARITRLIRQAMDSRDFLDIETPFLYKSTPEGAREFLVPSRISPGNFYALPQSPQTFKQILMVAGFDRYYQLVRCFRDEDFRSDRQPEFTQLDCELSFVDTDDILRIFSAVISDVVNKFFDSQRISNIPIMTHKEAMERFGCDKPDTRFGLELLDLTDKVAGCGFKIFANAASSGEIVNAICVEGQAASTSRKSIDEYEKMAKQFGLKGLAWAKINADSSWQSPLAKFLSDDEIAAISKAAQAKPNDLLLFAAGKFAAVKHALAAIRNHLGKALELYDPKQLNFLWVIDFPLLERAEDGHLKAMHHPFTAPKPQDFKLLSSDPLAVRAQAYDLVCNGWELGGGSIRIHSREEQNLVFKALGLSDEAIEHKFGFLIEALQYGAPPHGGIAFGLDRFVMVLTGSEGIRDLIAFPKTQKATCLMTSSPAPVPDQALADLGISHTSAQK